MKKRFISRDWVPPFGQRFAMAGGPGAPEIGPAGPRWSEAGPGNPGPQAHRGPRRGKRHRRHEGAERFVGARHMRGGRGGGPGFGGGGPGFGGGGPAFRGGGPGFGGGPFFGGGPRGRGRGRGRRRRGDVRMALLMLLAEEPRNGYQLMQIIEERSDGNWRPSPGSVYPVLSQLEDEGLVRAAEREGSRLFELTDAGRERLAEAKDATPPWEADDDDVGGRRDMRRLVGEVAAAAMQVNHLGDDQQVEQAIETMKNTRRTLYRILAEDQDV